jgi:hypothetical protein
MRRIRKMARAGSIRNGRKVKGRITQSPKLEGEKKT